jgi:hypothetical protein
MSWYEIPGLEKTIDRGAAVLRVIRKMGNRSRCNEAEGRSPLFQKLEKRVIQSESLETFPRLRLPSWNPSYYIPSSSVFSSPLPFPLPLPLYPSLSEYLTHVFTSCLREKKREKEEKTEEEVALDELATGMTRIFSTLPYRYKIYHYSS